MNSKITTVFILFFAAFTAKADISTELDDMLGTGWGTFTTTTAGSLTPDDIAGFNRQAYSFARMRIRTSSKRLNVLNFQAPALNFGCSGIDLTLGSFSFLSKDELIAMFRSIASNALSYSFGMAIQSMCPNCWAGMKSLQEDVQKLNNMFSSSCKIAESFEEDYNVGANLGTSFCQAISQLGSTDYMGCQTGPGNMEGAEKGNFYQDVKDAITSQGGDPEIIQGHGVILAEVISTLGADPNLFDAVPLNLLFNRPGMTATEVGLTLLGSTRNMAETSKVETLDPLVNNFDSLITGADRADCAGSNCFRVYSCSDLSRTGTQDYVCGAPTTEDVELAPLKERIADELNSMFELLSAAQPFNPAAFTESQTVLFQYFETPILRAILVARDKQIISGMSNQTETLATIVTYRVASAFLDDFTKTMGDLIKEGKDNTKIAGMLDLQEERLQRLFELRTSYEAKIAAELRTYHESEAYKTAFAEHLRPASVRPATISSGGQ